MIRIFKMTVHSLQRKSFEDSKWPDHFLYTATTLGNAGPPSVLQTQWNPHQNSNDIVCESHLSPSHNIYMKVQRPRTVKNSKQKEQYWRYPNG